MRIDCCHCGPRSAEEFSYLGDATVMRPGFPLSPPSRGEGRGEGRPHIAASQSRPNPPPPGGEGSGVGGPPTTGASDPRPFPTAADAASAAAVRLASPDTASTRGQTHGSDPIAPASPASGATQPPAAASQPARNPPPPGGERSGVGGTPTTGAGEWHDYVYLRDNPAGPHRELWQHIGGCRAWLVVTRDTRTHDILAVELARAAARPAASTSAAHE